MTPESNPNPELLLLLLLVDRRPDALLRIASLAIGQDPGLRTGRVREPTPKAKECRRVSPKQAARREQMMGETNNDNIIEIHREQVASILS